MISGSTKSQGGGSGETIEVYVSAVLSLHFVLTRKQDTKSPRGNEPPSERCGW